MGVEDVFIHGPASLPIHSGHTALAGKETHERLI